jgi:hypothetical protein
MPARPRAQETPTYVLEGTIKKLKSATMKEVPVDRNTAVVTVDRVIEAPPDLAGYDGQDITVQLSGTRKAAVGQRLIFHTASWLYGSSVAVRSLREEPVTAAHAAMLAPGGDPVERRRQREQRAHFDAADLVVSGKVVAVRLPSEAPQARAASLATGTTTRRPISEHDPKWREAVIQVDDVHKGDLDSKEVVVRFPASTDVMWHNAPKFHPGQQGNFLVHKTSAPRPRPSSRRVGLRDGTARDTKPVVTYTALDALDFQPYTEPGGVQAIIASRPTRK